VYSYFLRKEIRLDWLFVPLVEPGAVGAVGTVGMLDAENRVIYSLSWEIAMHWE
jgi:hypothetical protein